MAFEIVHIIKRIELDLETVGPASFELATHQPGDNVLPGTLGIGPLGCSCVVCAAAATVLVETGAIFEKWYLRRVALCNECFEAFGRDGDAWLLKSST